MLSDTARAFGRSNVWQKDFVVEIINGMPMMRLNGGWYSLHILRHRPDFPVWVISPKIRKIDNYLGALFFTDQHFPQTGWHLVRFCNQLSKDEVELHLAAADGKPAELDFDKAYQVDRRQEFLLRAAKG
jgi:hypothetical protein